MNLLSQPTSNPKVAKNIKYGVLTAPLHLAPYDLSGYQVCPMASKGCAAACLNTAGRGGIFKKGETTNAIQQARIRKTLMYFRERDTFLELLVKDIQKLYDKSVSLSRSTGTPLRCGVRLNATSDIPWEVHRDVLMDAFPEVQFYDYTKRHNRKNLPKNYYLTYSLAEDNLERAKLAIANGMNVAVVFRTKDFPKEFLGLPVINGDEHDYRPADPKGGTVIVGLKAKGKARHDTTGFVQDTQAA